MRHRNHRYRLSRLSAHREATVKSLLQSLFRHERITTTETKAKAIRPLADRLVTLAKRESLHARRQALAVIPDTDVIRRLFDTLAARYAERNGGYTRIIHAGVRRGDGAPMVLLELVDRPEAPPDAKGKKDKKERAPRGEAGATGRRGRKERAAAAAG